MLKQLHISVINTFGWGEKKKCVRVEKKVLVAQSYLTLWDPMECCLLGSSVHEILQARRLQRVASPFSRGSSCCCCIASVMSNSVRPHRRQPTRLRVPGILQARTLERGSSWPGSNMGFPHCRQILYYLSHPFYVLLNLICYI